MPTWVGVLENTRSGTQFPPWGSIKYLWFWFYFWTRQVDWRAGLSSLYLHTYILKEAKRLKRPLMEKATRGKGDWPSKRLVKSKSWTDFTHWQGLRGIKRCKTDVDVDFLLLDWSVFSWLVKLWLVLLHLLEVWLCSQSRPLAGCRS